MAQANDSFVTVCGKRVEMKNFRDYTKELQNEPISLINQIIENFEFDAIEGSFVTCGELSQGIGWVGDWKVDSQVETLGYYIRF